MLPLKQTSDGSPNVLLIATCPSGRELSAADETLAELAQLTETLGGTVVERQAVRLTKPTPNFLLGSGNVTRLCELCHKLECTIIIFDDELSPTQQRNWEKLAKVTVMDRHELILKIFAQRARTKEAELQIALAQAEFDLPRLKRAWSHLERQEGSMGVRGGPGEQQLELDSRMIRTKILKLKAELKLVVKRREQQRKKRVGVPMPNGAIVGYTNSGKSSLLNALTHATVLVEDKLFATLDPTTRRLRLPNRQDLLLTDTVGFVRKLPHDLVDAFKSTLEEAALADFLIHIVDASNPSAELQMQTTLEVLKDIGAGSQQMITLFNKMDLVSDPAISANLRRLVPDGIFASVKTGAGLDELVRRLEAAIEDRLEEYTLCLPVDRFDLVAVVHRHGQVLAERYEADGIHLRITLPRKFAGPFVPYQVALPPATLVPAL